MSRNTDTAAVELAQTPFCTVHKNMLFPFAKPVARGLVIVEPKRSEGPCIVVQLPVPDDIGLALRATVEVHIIVLALTAAGLGGKSRLIITTALELGHVPFTTVHVKELMPAARPLTLLPANEEVTTTAEPRVDHAPTPKVGSKALNKAIEEHIT